MEPYSHPFIGRQTDLFDRKSFLRRMEDGRFLKICQLMQLREAFYEESLPSVGVGTKVLIFKTINQRKYFISNQLLLVT